MEKQLKDYLHLYLGCECIVRNYYTSEWTKDVININLLFGNSCTGHFSYQPEFIKPLLRPLLSLTDEESLECGKGVLDLYPTKKMNDENGGRWSSTLYHPSQILWLLEKHFDLFGLIESGLAIGKTKLQTP